ncbi:hypothetical protein SKAU_G00321420 [Synaphobranchus kaupii]|uniref:CCDC92/74 N-terminal domain-containing protein n=1 Tax=Synaphobranchus kaupii TaxID=118154 RepID=A0A9Q1ENT7_SYNKA|nr:hypothetical protein SKAU_G00321420 [Synaphobranchus kaupii]
MASLPPGQGGEAVAMETDTLARQVDGVERSTAFLRQEHMALLRGLHLEILSLQRRCTELTCELNLKPPGRTQTDVEDEEEVLKARCQQAEAELREQQCTLGDVRREFGQKGALAGALRAALKDKERRFLEELKRRGHRITALNGELQRQTDTAARLSFQLYAARQTLHQQREQERHAPRGAQRPPPTPPPAPAPPPATRPKRRSHRPAAMVRAERARECVPRERVTGPEDPAPMPDPALFLYPRRHRPRSRHAHAHRSQRGLEGEGQREGPAEGGGPPRVDPAPVAAATEAE